jgi:hypothetical protein
MESKLNLGPSTGQLEVRPEPSESKSDLSDSESEFRRGRRLTRSLTVSPCVPFRGRGSESEPGPGPDRLTVAGRRTAAGTVMALKPAGLTPPAGRRSERVRSGTVSVPVSESCRRRPRISESESGPESDGPGPARSRSYVSDSKPDTDSE